ncbi:hypothetical protein PR202_gb24379 [Eleusine coracana subsp. coracana]|uniref:UBC core domain-containing protein n=1 Tax=Eleusine coracana subsp. coracana TaxID=191504 RepID=A0AAV5FLH8_ELECO|nr:hypothetical protein PR202_gb24379 [Eleusine coracana subsp. coracana]
MQDAAGQHICRYDHVKFKAPGGAHGDYGLALGSLPGGRVFALCADGAKVTVKSCNVTLADRSYVNPGMAVTSASDPDGQAGVITGAVTSVHVAHHLTGEVPTGVSKLRRVGRDLLRLGDYVVSKSNNQWLGLVVEVSLEVDVLFDDGAVCRVTDAGKKLRTMDHNETAAAKEEEEEKEQENQGRDVRGDQDRDKRRRVVAGRNVAARRAFHVANDDDEPPPAAQRLGIVRSFNHKDKTARVSWFDSNNNNDDNKQLDCDETLLSAYYLDPSPDHDLFYGQIVIRLRPTTDSSASTTTQEEEEEEQGAQQLSSSQESADLSWVGYIVDLCDAPYIQVVWGNVDDGNISKVLIHEIAAVRPQSLEAMLQEMGDWIMHDDDDNNAQAEDEEPRDENNSNNDDAQGDDDDSDTQSHGEDDGPKTMLLGWAGAVARAISRLAGNVLAKSKRYLVVNGPAVPATEETPEGGDASASRQGKAEADAIGADDDELLGFPHFDVVQSPPDHHYLDNMDQVGTIYVRAFEDRMDLFRAVMVGVSGTPYHDGLFFFDLQLPPSYPTVPPLVSYRSSGSV